MNIRCPTIRLVKFMHNSCSNGALQIRNMERWLEMNIQTRHMTGANTHAQFCDDLCKEVCRIEKMGQQYVEFMNKFAQGFAKPITSNQVVVFGQCMIIKSDKDNVTCLYASSTADDGQTGHGVLQLQNLSCMLVHDDSKKGCIYLG